MQSWPAMLDLDTFVVLTTGTSGEVMEVDKQLKFKSHKPMLAEFISNNIGVMTHDCLSSVALALVNSQWFASCHADFQYLSGSIDRSVFFGIVCVCFQLLLLEIASDNRSIRPNWPYSPLR